jgi:glyoxylase-like metal-dependent hydrolase (beta-lactamase superfamily II)
MKINRLKVLGILWMLFASTQSTANNAELTTLKLNDNLYVILGGNGQGSHVGLSVDEKSIVLIDTMLAKSKEKLLKAIGSISKKPVKYIINTHNHFDHIGGNPMFSKLGATIVLPESTNIDHAVEHLVFENKLSLNHGDEQIELQHVASHSDSDVIIFLKTSNVVFMGDVFATGWYPALFYGGIASQNKAIDRVLSWADDNTKIVPGHGEISTKSDLLAYKKTSMLWVDRIMALHSKGMALEDIIKDEKLIKIRAMFKRPSTNTKGFERWFPDLVKNTITVESKVKKAL